MKKKYKAIEKLLYDYKGNQNEIKDIEIQIARIENNYIGIAPISYEERVCTSNSISSSVENETIRKQEQIERLEKKKEQINMNTVRVENALQLLTEIERDVIEGKYINRLQWFKIAYNIGYSESWTKNIRKEAMSKLVERIHL